MSNRLDFIDQHGARIVSVNFSQPIRFDGHIATLPRPRTPEQEESLHLGIILMNNSQADVQVDGRRVIYLFQ